MKKMVFVTPSLSSGGAERVISELAGYVASLGDFEVFVICMVKEKRFYSLPAQVKVIEPDFNHRDYNRIAFTSKIFWYLRKTLAIWRPDFLLSFGGKYNAFVLLAARGLNIQCFISERSRPGISYGKLLDLLNPIVYKLADGIVAQTRQAQEELYKQTRHNNIRVIGNPIKMIARRSVGRENIILNVGRFISSKNQSLLVEYFAAVTDGTWKLVFLGEGAYLESTKLKARELGLGDSVFFAGVSSDVTHWYSVAKIFAFTSVSEGFPNVLGEALSTPLASISFDCSAGPSDLIEDGVNGFLVQELNHEEYKCKLKKLMSDEALRSAFESVSTKRIQKFQIGEIGKQYLAFITE